MHTQRVSYYTLVQSKIRENSTEIISPVGAQRHLWWCDFLSVVNIIFFFFTILLLLGVTFKFLRQKK